MVIALFLFVVGVATASFVNALVWRVHEQAHPSKSKNKKVNLSIVNGRSVCPHCHHQLTAIDLIPIVSWLMLGGKCRYCHKPIPDSPIVELVGGLIFAGSYLAWPLTVHLNGQWLLLATWLAASVGLLALAVYDLRWMILPNRIIYPTLLVAVAGKAAYTAAFDPNPAHSIGMWLLSVAIASGVFFVIFTVSQGKWIGYGDVRLGLITGTLLGHPQKSLLMLFLASLIGTLVITPALVAGKKTLASKLPYGPFLILATAIVVVYGDSLLDWYKRVMGL